MPCRNKKKDFCKAQPRPLDICSKVCRWGYLNKSSRKKVFFMKMVSKLGKLTVLIKIEGSPVGRKKGKVASESAGFIIQIIRSRLTGNQLKTVIFEKSLGLIILDYLYLYTSSPCLDFLNFILQYLFLQFPLIVLSKRNFSPL